jgi:exosortase A
MFVKTMQSDGIGNIANHPSPSYKRLTVLAVVVALLLPFIAYFGTAKSIVAIWNSSETFAHGYVILPISLWLIWRRRENFHNMPPTPYWPAIVLLTLAGFAWLIAQMGEVQVVMQYAFVAMLPIIALAVLGKRLTSSLAFPLLFLLMAVPFGEIFIDPLIGFTADFTVWALQQSGIPVLRSGSRFEIPSGSWSVVEACSGVRYLISSVTLGWLYAYLTYRSVKRRALFMVIAVIVPIVANWLRAYMIVMIGHLSGMTLAVGIDHIIYGWLFFGLVMFLMFWIGSFWREDQEIVATTVAVAPTIHKNNLLASPYTRSSAYAIVAITSVVAAITIAWPLLAHVDERVTHNPAPVELKHIATSWAQAPAFFNWKPHFSPPSAEVTDVFRDPVAADRQPVALSVLYYRNQRNGKELISSTNRLVSEKSVLNALNQNTRIETIGGRTLTLREASIQGPDGVILVWYCYWIDATFTANNYVGKLLQAKAKLLFRGDDGAAVVLSSPYTNDPEQARYSMRAFLGTHLSAIESTLNLAKGS